MPEIPVEEESVGRSVYEHLVRLTFLCGRGLPLSDLMVRFLKAMRPSIPASGVWLFRESQMVAKSVEDGLPDPPPPGNTTPMLAPTVDAEDRIHAFVLPGMVLVCQLKGRQVQRAADVVTLFARIVALAWQAETLNRSEPWPDSYVDAKMMFKRRWLTGLIERHDGNISAAARTAQVSRVYLYDMMKSLGMSSGT
jgi:hypothetical protein